MNPPPVPALPQDFGDHFSPIVVKELRQGLRTRFFTYALTLFHIALILLVAGVNLVELPLDAMNGIFWALTGLMLLVVLPLRGFDALHREARAGTLDMLALTSMPARRILQGKWAAIYGQTLLVACSLLPYMVARYFFGGVEIAREALGLVSLVLGSGILSAALLAFSSQASLLLRLTLAVALGFAAFPLGAFVTFVVTSTQADRMIQQFTALALWWQGGIFLLVLSVTGYAVWFFLAMGASRIAPPSENHSTRKRVVMVLAHGAFMVTGLAVCAATGGAEAGIWFFLPLLVFTLFGCMDLMTEEMPRFPTSVAGLARRGEWGSNAGRVLHPGWASGTLLSLLLSGMMVVFTVGIIMFEKHAGSSWWVFVAVIICLCASTFVPAIIRVNRANRFANWWAVQAIMMGAGVFLSLAGAVSGGALGMIGVVTPVTTLFGSASSRGSGEGVLTLGSIIGVVWMVAAVVKATEHLPLYRELEDQALSLDKPPPPPAADVPAA